MLLSFNRIALSTFALLLIASTGLAQTRDFLRAPRVESRVRVQWDARTHRVLAAIDDDEQFRPLAALQPFLVAPRLTVTYPRLNPLRIAAAAVPAGEPVVTDAVTASLRALTSMASTTLPPSGTQGDVAGFMLFAASATCPPAVAASSEAATLAKAILVRSQTRTIGTLLSMWREAIDEGLASGQNGADAVAATVALMDHVLRDLEAILSASGRALARIDAELARATSSDDACARSTRTLYEAVMLANPSVRLTDLTAARAAVAALRNALDRQYVVAAKWHGSEYVLAENIQPPRDEAVTMAIQVTDSRLDIDAASGGVTAIAETTTSETMTTRRYSRFAREFAVASVLGTVTSERLGTTTNASGATVVSRLPRSIASIAPAFLVSFVCRCQTGPLVAPMLQVGVTTSTDVPSILAGGGVRLFGLPRGDIALGTGAMIAWVKDLASLRVGDRVGGTLDIEADLQYTRRHGYYLALQYKF